MTDRQRTAQVDIVNTSQVQATYKITLVRKRMTETGEFQDVVTPEPEERFADEVVRYSPRQVTLVPGAGQTIRLMFKAPPTLAEGEYRSHLLFSKPPAAISALPGKEAKEQNTISMSIPVIARHGNLEAKAAIDPASVKVSEIGEKKQLVGFTLTRSGARSIYGDVVVYRGKEKVAEGKGFAVYTPNAKRKVGVPVLECTRSEESGYYLFKTVRPGSYLIVIPDAEAARLKAWPVRPLRIAMPVGGDMVAGQDIFLEPAAPVSGTTLEAAAEIGK